MSLRLELFRTSNHTILPSFTLVTWKCTILYLIYWAIKPKPRKTTRYQSKQNLPVSLNNVNRKWPMAYEIVSLWDAIVIYKVAFRNFTATRVSWYVCGHNFVETIDLEVFLYWSLRHNFTAILSLHLTTVLIAWSLNPASADPTYYRSHLFSLFCLSNC